MILITAILIGVLIAMSLSMQVVSTMEFPSLNKMGPWDSASPAAPEPVGIEWDVEADAAVQDEPSGDLVTSNQ